jgi:hypothetical protein
VKEAPRDVVLKTTCWCGAGPGQPCLGRPDRFDNRRERVSFHRWRHGKALQPAFREPSRPLGLA